MTLIPAAMHLSIARTVRSTVPFGRTGPRTKKAFSTCTGRPVADAHRPIAWNWVVPAGRALVFTVAPTATAWEATATAVNVTVHPVHPFVPAATLDVAVTDVVPADADRLYAEYNWLLPDAVSEARRVNPAGSVQVTAEFDPRCSRNEHTARSPDRDDAAAVHVVTADAVPAPEESTLIVALATSVWNSARAARTIPVPSVNVAEVIPPGFAAGGSHQISLRDREPLPVCRACTQFAGAANCVPATLLPRTATTGFPAVVPPGKVAVTLPVPDVATAADFCTSVQVTTASPYRNAARTRGSPPPPRGRPPPCARSGRR